MASGFPLDSSTFRMLLEQQLRLADPVDDETVKKYTSKKFLVKDYTRLVKDAVLRATIYTTTLIAEPSVDIRNTTQVKLSPENRVDIIHLVDSIDKPMKGKFLLCRTVSPPLKMTGIAVIVDDPEGSLALRYVMYNLFPEATTDSVIEFIPLCTIMAVKNPYFKTSADGGYGLRTDNPGDIVFLNEQQCRERFPDITWKGAIPKVFRKYVRKSTPKTVEEWRILGDNYFEKKNYVAALNAYTSGLKDDTRSVSLLANRSTTYLHMFAYRKALNDAEEVLNIEPFHIKAICQKVKALCSLKRYNDAHDYLMGLETSKLEKSDQLDSLKSKLMFYLHQSTTGEYDVPFIVQKAYENPAYNFDYADYVGPVEVRETLGKGRGLFATDHIKPGQLVIGSKAFALHIPDTSDRLNYNWKWKSILDPLTINDREDNGLADLVTRILTLAPEKCEELYKLYAGPDMGYLNVENEDDTDVIDNKRIRRICTYNSFYSQDKDVMTPRQTHEGLWLLPSMINHSCYDCNCNWMVFGDFVLIRAFREIPQGGEILVSYITPELTFPNRMDIFEDLGFLCDCSLCELDQQETKKVNDKRDRWLQEFTGVMEFADGEINDPSVVKCYVSRIASLRRNNPKMNIYLVRPLMAFSHAYRLKKLYAKAAEMHEKVFELIKDTTLLDACIKILTDIITEYLLAGEVDKAEKWIVQLKEKLFVAFGFSDVTDALPHVAALKKQLKEIGLSL